MRELDDIVARRREAAARGEAVTLATLVDCEGSTYRRPGARALVLASGEVTGLLSGGCLEADVAERSKSLGPGGLDTVTYDLRDEDDVEIGLGLGCRGVLTLLLERLEPGAANDPIERIARAAAATGRGQRGACALVYAGPSRGRRVWLEDGRVEADPAIDPARAAALARACADVAARGRALTLREHEALVEPLPRRRTLLVVGAGPDAVPVVEQARAVGLRVVLWDHRATALARPDFARADARREVRLDALGAEVAALAPDAAIVMTHNQRADIAALGALAGASLAYLGLLGPRERALSIAATLAEQGVTLAGLRAPAGLDIGAESPEAIALSVVAEVHAALEGRSGGKLSDRKGPIHDRAA